MFQATSNGEATCSNNYLKYSVLLINNINSLTCENRKELGKLIVQSFPIRMEQKGLINKLSYISKIRALGKRKKKKRDYQQFDMIGYGP